MAFKQMVPPKVYQDTKDIQNGKKAVSVPKTKLIIEDDKKDIVITLTDNNMNQLTTYFMDEYGSEFGLLYFTALWGGKKLYKSTKKMFERMNNE